MEDVPCDKLPLVLEGLVPYHTREKTHRVRGSAAKPGPVAKPADEVKVQEPAVRLLRPVLNPT